MQPDWRRHPEHLVVNYQKRRLVQIVKGLRPACVLDLGCKEGWLLRQLSSLDIDCLGVDLFPMHSKAMPPVYGANLNTAETVMVFQRIVKESYTPDVVVMSHLLEHLHNPVRLIESIKAKFPKAKLVIVSPGVRSIQSLWHWLINKPPVYAATWDGPHYKDFTTRTMREMVESMGYNMTRQENVDWATPWGDKPWLCVVPFMATSFLQVYKPKI